MPLHAGSRLGPYEVLSPLGAGGMGEVYRARDPRLGREVAVKIIASDVEASPERLRRFEDEARAAGALNHPNVLSVFDVGLDGGSPYVVFELLEGETLRERLERGPLSVRKALEYAVQTCQGLAAAHGKEIVHRDLKPENLFLTREGRVKILDFGLAKLTQGPDAKGAVAGSHFETATQPGLLLGTVAYMSPEQARGESADARSDIFALGATVYEMLSGRRAFQRPTTAETVSAILSHDPPDIASVSGEPALPGLERIVRRCLEKDPEERFQSARDLAFALDALSGSSQAEALPVAAAPSRRWLRVGATALLLLAGMAGAYLWGSRRATRPLPSYKQLTFRRGAVLDDARFTADGNTVVYSGLWDGNPPETFTTRLDTPVSRSLGLPPARLLSVSAQGELAILLATPGDTRGDWQGTLARVSLAGGAPREVAGDVWRADWSPDGRELAIVRLVDGEARLEYPIGRVLRSPVSAQNTNVKLRVSPQGDKVALVSDEGLLIVDGAGKATRIVLPQHIQGLAWAAGGDAIWAASSEFTSWESLWYAPLDGKAIEVAREPGHLYLHDVSRDGRFLVHFGTETAQVRAKAPGEATERDLTVFDDSASVGLSADGGQLLLEDSRLITGESFLRPTRGGPAIPVAEGWPVALSPDAKWVLSVRPRHPLKPSQFVLTPTGVGEPRSMPWEGLDGVDAGWFADGGHAVFNAATPGGRRRAFVLDLQAGTSTAVTPEGVLAVPGSLSEGSVIGYRSDGTLAWYGLTGGPPRPIAARVPKGARAVQASADQRVLFVFGEGVPGHVDRLDLATGRRSPWKTLKPEDPAGVYIVWGFKVTPDGEAYAYSYYRLLQQLFLVDGLR